MSSDEVSYLRSAIENSRRYLEFGSGFSTKIALENSNRVIYSIETSEEYIRKLREELAASGADLSNLNFLHIDIGPTRDWGRPIDESAIERWPRYSQIPWDRIKEDNFKPDLILVDGRFRVITFLQAWRNAPGAIVIFDDFNNRPIYHKILKVLTPIEVSGRVASFRIPGILRYRKYFLWKRLLPIFRYDFE